jgi:porin
MRCVTGCHARSLTVSRHLAGALVACAVLLLACPAARAQDGAPEDEEAFDKPSVAPYLGGDPAARIALRNAGVRWHAIYTGDLFSNVSGGISRGTTYGGRLELGIEADLEKLVGWSGATFTATAFLIHGRGQTGDHLGNLLAVSNAEAVPAARLFELWLEQKIGSVGSLRIGQLAADSEFIGSENAGLFINGTFGWPGITGANLPSGGPAYPLATPGARVEFNIGSQTKLRAAIFNGDPSVPGAADPQRANRHGVNFRLRDDPFLIAELAHSYKLGAAALPGTVKLGAWYHAGTFADQRIDTIGLSLANPASSTIPASLRASWGPYAVIDQMLARLPGPGERSIGGFARVSVSPDDRSLIDFYADAGITVKGLFASRPDDKFGVAFGFARISNRARALDRDTVLFGAPGYPIRDYEAVLELSYKYQVVEGWTIQPDVQYVFHPGGNVPHPNDPTMTRPVRNALVIGVRSTVQY